MSNLVMEDPSQQQLREQIKSSQASFEGAFRRQFPLLWWGTLTGPFLCSAAILLWLYLTGDPAYVWKVCAAAAATFFVFSKFVILGGHSGEMGEIAGFLSRGELTLLVIYMDIMTALILVFHMGFVFRLPFIGKKLEELTEDGEFILAASPWMRRATFVGLVAFIVFPLTATGAVGGSIFGRLLGMTRVNTLLAITIGSTLGCGLMYFGAGILDGYLDRDNPVMVVGGIAVMLALLFLLNARYQQLKKAHHDHRENSVREHVVASERD